MSLFDPKSPTIYSVTRLNREVRGLLESNFGLLWIEAEISNFSTPASGHWYFSLKDERAQVKAAMFKNRNMLSRLRPQNGNKVLVRARISVYEPRGDYQLIVEHMEAAGQGDLQRQFDELKEKLEKEGLFRTETKLSLPAFPRKIGLITSPTGAAIRDVLSVLKRRYPLASVLIFPVSVQGESSISDIQRAINSADKRGDCDVLVLTRGGGSMEDLWSFNSESVARSIAKCSIPLVAGIGHETDFTIAELVADRRAPTPSVAAEMVTPNQDDLHKKLNLLNRRFQQRYVNIFKLQNQNFKQLQRRLQIQDPHNQLMHQHQRLDQTKLNLERCFTQQLNRYSLDLEQLKAQLSQHHPQTKLEIKKNTLNGLQNHLIQGVQKLINNSAQKLALASRSIDTLSPLKTLNRGYSITMVNNVAASSVTQVTQGDRVEIRFKDGHIEATAQSINLIDSRFDD